MRPELTPEYLAADQSWRLLQVAVAFAILEILFVSLYVGSRLKSGVKQEADFYLIIAALIVNLGLVVVCFAYAKMGGLGHHIEVVTPSELISFTKSKLALIYLYIAAVTLPKLAILSLYLRVFQDSQHRGYRYAAFAIAGILVVCLGIAWVLSTVICTPFAYNWDPTIVGGKCLNKGLMYIMMSLPNIGSDFAIFVLPLPIILNLQLSRNQKIGLVVTFATGSMGIITAIIRLVIFKKLGDDRDYSWSATDTVMWTVIEPGIYLIASSLPSLRSLFKPLSKKISLSTFNARFQSSLPSKSFIDSSIRGTNGSRVSYKINSLWTTQETDSSRCFSRLDGRWQSDGISGSEPRTSVSCYRTSSLINEADEGSVLERDQKLRDVDDKTANPFVIRVLQTTSLSSEPKIARLIN